MSDFTIYLILASLLVAFWIWEIWDSKKSATKDNLYAEGEKVGNIRTFSFNSNSGNSALREEIENETEVADDSMAFLECHRNDECAALNISDSVATFYSRNLVQQLRVGDQLFLVRSFENRQVRYNVFFGGKCISQLSVLDSELIEELLTDSVITGVYVWDQNSDHIVNLINVKIVIFYRKRSEICRIRSSFCEEPYKLHVNGPEPFFLFQN